MNFTEKGTSADMQRQVSRMGPGPMGGPPPHSVTDQNRQRPPKKFSEVPGFVRRVLGAFFTRLFYIFRLVWDANRGILFLMMFMALFNGVMPVVGAYISANLLNGLAEAYLGQREFSQIMVLMLIQFGYLFVNSIVMQVNTIVTRMSGEVVTNHIQIKIMNKAKEVDLASFDRPSFYEKLENASREAGMRPIQILNASFTVLSSVISMVSFVTILAAVSPVAPILVILLAVPSAVINFIYRKKNVMYMRHRSKERRQMSYYSQTMVDKDAVKEIRLFGLSDLFIGRYRKVFAKYFGGLKKLIAGEGVWNLSLTIVTTAVNCALFLYIAARVCSGEMQVGDYSLYTGALNSISNGVASLISTTATIYEGTLFIDNLIAFMKEKRTVVPALPEALPVKRHCAHTIRFEHVYFRYPGTEKDVLRDISFTLEAGDTAVLVGLNGAGKTTLIKLLTRLYDPTGGTIYLDGEDIRHYRTEELYKMFGIIFQDFGKYAFTVSENIAFGDISREKNENGIEEAARQSSADAFIRKLSDGYDTPLMRYFEDNGTELSIGQWQKIAVARAFYSDSDILILDEPTASLDAIAEQEIFSQFERLRQDKTTIFVSHRLSSATTASKILVLDNGEIAETGTHAELMAQRGRYYTLFSTQAKRYIDSDTAVRKKQQARAEGAPDERPVPNGGAEKPESSVLDLQRSPFKPIMHQANAKDE